MFFVTYVWAELRHRLRQAMLIAAGLGLGISVVITVAGVASGVAVAQGKVLQALYGVGTDINVTTPNDPSSGPGFRQPTPGAQEQHIDALQSLTSGSIEAARVDSIAHLGGVAAAAGGLVLTESKSTFPAVGQFPPNGIQPPILNSVIGVDLAHPGLGPYSTGTIASGRAFTTSDNSANNAVLSANYAGAHGLSVGQVITIADSPFTVVGIVSQPQDNNPPDIYIPLPRAQTLAKLDGYVNTIYVKATSAGKVSTVSREISGLMPSARVTSSTSLADEVSGSLATAAGLAGTLGTWLSILSLIAAFGVASLLTLAAVSRRAREFGTLKALGWPARRIILQLIGESVLIGFIGAIAGVGLGLAGAALAPKLAPNLSATVQEANSSQPADAPGANGGFFTGTIGGSMTTFANPNATHTVAIPFTAPVTTTTIGEAVALALLGGIGVGAVGSWRIARLRPAVALARVE